MKRNSKEPVLHPSGRDYRMDGHTHTLACGHAYSTLEENVAAAKKAGIDVILWNEHSPAMPHSAGEMFFQNYKAVPPVIDGVRVLKGMEADILDSDGTIACPEGVRGGLEFLSASFHSVAKLPGDREENTQTLIRVMEKNPDVDFLCHLGNPQYPIDYERVVLEAKKRGVMIEINNGSFSIRKGSKDNCVEIAKLCVKHGVKMILGTDAHFSADIGKFPNADRALLLAGAPDELIVNLDPEAFIRHLKEKGKPVGLYNKEKQYDVFRDEFPEDA